MAKHLMKYLEIDFLSASHVTGKLSALLKWKNATQTLQSKIPQMKMKKGSTQIECIIRMSERLYIDDPCWWIFDTDRDWDS